ncbi:MAG: hypothetical protein Aurels2KO_25630 [Aureliella sp.]
MRLFQPESEQAWTVRRVFDELRWPELAPKASSKDGQRFIAIWGKFESNCRRVAYPSSVLAPSDYPIGVAIRDVSSRMLRAYQDWLKERFPPPKGSSTINKAVREIVLLLKLAAAEGLEVSSYRPPKDLPTEGRPRYYFDDASVGKLWAAAENATWPKSRQTGVDPCVFWRSLLIMLRTYGPRVQDFAAYNKGKSKTRPKVGLLWRDVTIGEDGESVPSPNFESLETWPLGWIYYMASKTAGSSGRKYYLPITPPVRGALDRLRAGALAAGTLSPAARVFPLSYSNTLPKAFAALQASAGVATRDGRKYELEDFRKTVATYSAAVDPGLPHALCGWGGSGVQQKHYQQPEVLLVKRIMDVPMPACFSQWAQAEHVTAVEQL